MSKNVWKHTMKSTLNDVLRYFWKKILILTTTILKKYNKKWHNFS